MKLKDILQYKTAMPIRQHFCCEWSEDDCLSVLSTSVVDIFHFSPNLKSSCDIAPFKRSVIYPLLFYPTDNAGFKQDMYSKVSKDDLSRIMYDSLIGPLQRHPQEPPIISQALWSSSKLFPSGKCILALLTISGSVTFWVYQINEWSMLENISQSIHSIVKENNHDVPDSNYVTNIKLMCNKLATSSIVWSNIYSMKDTNILFFVSIQRNGCIFIWRVSANNILDISLTVTLEMEHFIDLENITSCLWISISERKAVLVVGNSSGIISSLHFSVSSDCKLSYVKTEYLWSDKDRLRVNRIVSTRWDSNYFCIIAVKEAVLVCLTVDQEGNLKSMTYEHLDNLTITGIQEIGHNEFIVATFKGVLINVILIPDVDGNPKMTKSVIETDTNMSKWNQHSVVTSKSKAFFIKAVSPCIMPQRNISVSNIIISYNSEVDQMDKVVHNERAILTDVWDQIELARLKKMKNLDNVEKWAFKYSDSLSLYETKVYYWTSLFMKDDITEEEIDKIKKRIIILHAKKYIEKLLNKYFETKTLMESDLKTLSLQIRALKYFNTISEEFNLILFRAESELGNVLPEISQNCDLCNEELFAPFCSKNHPRQYCCITFQDVNDNECLVCPRCNVSACSDLIMEGPLCIFCDIHLQYNILLGERKNDNNIDLFIKKVG